MSIYMKAKGLNGDVSAKGHQNSIELHSVNFNASRQISVSPGNVQNQSVGKPHFNHLTVTKALCSGVADLMNHFNSGNAIDEMTISLCTQDGGMTPYFEYTLYNAMISNISFSTIDLSESTNLTIQLSYTKIMWRFTPRDSRNQVKSPIAMGYDLAHAEAM